MTAATKPLRAIGFVAAAVACFAALDTTTKLVSTAVPVAMAIWFRYLFQALATGVARAVRGHGVPRTRHPWLQVTRGALLALTSLLSFLSLRAMPVGEFTAVVMLTPLVITLMAASALGEKVSPLRWALVAGGFIGAMVVIRPNRDDFNWTLLLPLGLVATNAAFQIITSRLAKLEDASSMHFYTGCVGAGLATLALPLSWQAIAPHYWAVLVMVGLFSTIGHYFLILAYGRAPASVLTPFLYLQIGFAMVFGWVVFKHVPDRWSVLGVLMIAACGAGGTWLTQRETVTK